MPDPDDRGSWSARLEPARDVHGVCVHGRRPAECRALGHTGNTEELREAKDLAQLLVLLGPRHEPGTRRAREQLLVELALSLGGRQGSVQTGAGLLLASEHPQANAWWNILDLDFLGKYYLAGDEAQKTYAVENTLYVIAQYFGWSEILRREIQFLNFSDSTRTRTANTCQRRIVQIFQSDGTELGRPFLVWRGEQRAIGELMIDTTDGQAHCIGYATFMGRREPGFRNWFERLESDIDELAHGTNPRLLELQHALVDLIRELDPQGLRYSDDILRKV